MVGRKLAKAAIAFLALGILTVPLMAQPGPPPAPSAPLDATAKREIVAKLAEALRQRYVFPDVGERAAARIEAALATGEYDRLSQPSELARTLAANVQAIAHDKHLRIMAAGGPPPGPEPDGGPPPRNEAGVTRADKLSNGIGYVEVVAFPPPPMFKPVIDRAMAGLKGSKALIIDIRRNGGGSPEAVSYLVSYLVRGGQPVAINDIISRVPNTTEFKRESYRSVPTPVSFGGVPVYVLTSKGTFSGGEEFAYDVQALKVGTLIGETTGGGANPTGPVDLGHDMMASIPWGRAENAVTKANWEGRGVSPDVAVPAGDALKVALEKAGAKPAAEIGLASVQQVFAPRSTPRPGSEAALRKLIMGYASGAPDLSAMTSGYAAEARQETAGFQKEFAPLGALQSLKFRQVDMMSGDEFELDFANGKRVMAIVLDENGKILAASGLMPDVPGMPGG